MPTVSNPYEDEIAMSEYLDDVVITAVGRYSTTKDGINASCPVCGEGSSGHRKKRFYYYRNTLSAHCFNVGCPLNEKSPKGLMLSAMIKGVDLKEENLEYIKWYKKRFRHVSVAQEPLPDINAKEEEQEITETQEKPIQSLFEDSWIDLPPIVKDYCEQRKMFEAPYAPKNWTFYFDQKTKRLVIPWKNERTGQIEYWQKRALLKGDSPKYLYPSGLSKSDFVFNLDKISDDWKYILLTEGCIDAAFSYNTVAIGGIKPSENQLRQIKERYPNHILVVAIDNPWVDRSAKLTLIGDKFSGSKGLIDQHKFDRMFFMWDKRCPYKDINECACAAHDVYPFDNREWLKRHIITAIQAKLMFSM